MAIRTAYLALISKYHPDTWEGERLDAERCSKLINEAYSVLRHERSRSAYDLSLRRPTALTRAAERPHVASTSGAVPHVPLRRFKTLWLALCAIATPVAICYSSSDRAPVTFSGDAATRRSMNLAVAMGDIPGQESELARASRSEAENWPTAEMAEVQSDGNGDAYYESAWRAIGRPAQDDEFALQFTCSSAKRKGSADYQACLNQHVDEDLAGANQFPTTVPDESEIIAAQLACEPLRIGDLRAYERCVDAQLGIIRPLRLRALPSSGAVPSTVRLVRDPRSERRRRFSLDHRTK